MGNAGSNSMHRERQKSSDLSTPNSPFRELPVVAAAVVTRESLSSQRSSIEAAVNVNVNANVVGAAQVFTFDKKPDTRSVLNGGSSQEDEEQPYYTKPIGSVDSEYTQGTPGQKRKRCSTSLVSTTQSQSQMSGKESIESNEDSEEVEQGNSADDAANANKNPALPTVLRWDGGGRNVMISGTFSKWKPIPMVRSHGNFVTIIDLPMGDHQYKFCVDGEWKHDPKLKSIEIDDGKRNNLVSVRQSDFEVFQALAKDSENVPNYAEKEYSQEVPQSKPWEKTSGPPVLPPHLLQVILNKDTPLSVSY